MDARKEVVSPLFLALFVAIFILSTSQFVYSTSIMCGVVAMPNRWNKELLRLLSGYLLFVDAATGKLLANSDSNNNKFLFRNSIYST